MSHQRALTYKQLLVHDCSLLGVRGSATALLHAVFLWRLQKESCAIITDRRPTVHAERGSRCAW